MPLNIHLRKSQRIIINGAVIENISAQNVSLRVMNSAAILRDNDILTPEEAVTPASRTYYALQCLYLFPEERDVNLSRFDGFISSYVKAAPSSKPIVDEVRRLVEEGSLYHALKKAQELIAHEHEVFSHVQERISKELRGAAGAGQPAGDRGVGADPGGTQDARGKGDQ